MWRYSVLLMTLVFVSTFGAPQSRPQFIENPSYYVPRQQINPSSQYVLAYPQYQLVVPREGEEGGGFWQSIVSYFGSCGEGGDSLVRSVIPPTVDITRIPEREADKVGEKDKVDKIEQTQSKPFYFVLPPTLAPNYNYPQSSFLQPNFLPKYYNSPFLTFPNTKSQIIPRNNVANSDISSDVKPSGIEVKENVK